MPDEIVHAEAPNTPPSPPDPLLVEVRKELRAVRLTLARVNRQREAKAVVPAPVLILDDSSEPIRPAHIFDRTFRKWRC
jgi:hypothetical protein